jgi:hypothetical protein
MALLFNFWGKNGKFYLCKNYFVQFFSRKWQIFLMQFLVCKAQTVMNLKTAKTFGFLSENIYLSTKVCFNRMVKNIIMTTSVGGQVCT